LFDLLKLFLSQQSSCLDSGIFFCWLSFYRLWSFTCIALMSGGQIDESAYNTDPFSLLDDRDRRQRLTLSASFLFSQLFTLVFLSNFRLLAVKLDHFVTVLLNPCVRVLQDHLMSVLAWTATNVRDCHICFFLKSRVFKDVVRVDELFNSYSLVAVVRQARVQEVQSLEGEFDGLGETPLAFIEVLPQSAYISKRIETSYQLIEDTAE